MKIDIEGAEMLALEGATKLSINLFIYESGPIEEKIEDVLFMQILDT